MNIERIPLQDDYEVELSQGISDSALTFVVDTAPLYTISRKTWAVINPGKDNMELVKVDSYVSATKTFTIPSGGRAQPLYEGDTGKAYTHGSGSVVMISDNFSFWNEIYDAVNSKLDGDGGNGEDGFSLALPGSNWRLRDDSGVMKFRDDNQAEVTLSQLASLSGVNDKFKISVNDTTEGYANGKLVAGTNVTFVENNDGGNETLTISATSANETVTGHDVYTPAYLTGGSSAEGTFSNWLAVLAGSFRITIDGTAYNIDGINFTGVTSMADVASYIQTALRAATGGLETVVWSTDHFVITSADTTSSSQVSVTTTSTGTVGTDISGAGASNWMDADTGNGVATAAVVDPSADAGKVPELTSTGMKRELLVPLGKGELETGDGTTNDVLAAGTDGYLLAADSSADEGLAYYAPSFVGPGLPLPKGITIVRTCNQDYFTSNGTSISVAYNGSWMTATAATGACNVVSDTAIYYGKASASPNMGFDDSITTLIAEWRSQYSSDGVLYAGNVQLGLVSNASALNDYDDATYHAISFSIDASRNLYAHTSNASGHTETAISGVTLTNANTFRIVWNKGTNAQFYVNGVLKATVTTTLPTGGDILWGIGITESLGDAYVSTSQPTFTII